MDFHEGGGMIVVVFAILGLFALMLVVVRVWPTIVGWLQARDDEADHDPYNFWGRRTLNDNEDWE